MRLLQVAGSGSIHFIKTFHESEIPRRYAILSHTWGDDGDEVTLQNLQQGGGVDKPGYKKIQFCAEQAQRDGLEFFWVDTCCIDKTNQDEVSRAINSMFRWYKRAEKCYVYLSDVPHSHEQPSSSVEDWEADFRRSRWFKRGWTLQELLAPTSVEFFSRHGDKLGDKGILEKQLRDITKIPVEALRGNPMASFTKQERFSWEENRQTKEEEDIVYSLLGIFGVFMPVLYGEGKHNAKKRLEREIDIARKGSNYESFSIAFALPDVVETSHFVARQGELEYVRKALSGDGARKSVTIHGLGGIGKTQLAIAYAVRHRDDYSAIFWTNAKDEDSLKLSFAKIARQIAREHPTASGILAVEASSNLDEVVSAVKGWLSLPSNTRWLMICDNYDHPKTQDNLDPMALDLRQFFPESYQGSLIVTTRSSQVEFGRRLRLEKLKSLEDGLAILSHASERSKLDHDPDAIELAKILDGLPLALATAGAHLRRAQINFEDYCRLYKASWAKLQEKSPHLDSYENRKLYSTWQISFDQIQQRNRVSANLLRLWAYFDNEDIWFELLCHTNEDSPAWFRELTQDVIDFHNAVGVLCDYGIVEANAVTQSTQQSGGYSMHSCVHSWTKTVLNAELDKDLARLALQCVGSYVPETTTQRWWEVQRRLLNHASRQLVGHEANVQDDMSWAYYNIASLFADQAKLAEAEAMYQRALQGEENAFGRDHMSTLQTVNNLGNLYRDQGKLVEAEEMYQRALQGYENTLGQDDTSTLYVVNNLSNLYADQGKLPEAEKMCQRALQGLEKTLGRDHTSTLDLINNLGILYKDQGKLVEAEEMYQRVLKGTKEALGRDHISTLETINNLGVLYAKQGKLAEAEEMYQRALQGNENALGRDHTSTLQIVNNLGNLYAKQGKLAEAEEMYQLALQGRENTLGRNHISTLDTVINLGTLYADQGKLVDAVEMLQRALQGRESALGRDHMSTLATVSKLGLLYADQGKLVDAEEMYQRMVSTPSNLPPQLRKRVTTLREKLILLKKSSSKPQQQPASGHSEYSIRQVLQRLTRR